MANIKISNLQPAGSDLLSDSESYLNELSQEEFTTTKGGITPTYIITFSVVTTTPLTV